MIPLDGARVETPGLHLVRDGSRLLAVLPVNASERESLLERAGESARSLLARAEPSLASSAPGALDLSVPTVAAGLVLLLVSSIVANRGLFSIARARASLGMSGGPPGGRT